ncbi:kinase pkk2 [Diaporthe eres]|nr:kinase pkk2 [Diaporthe eres]
MTDNAEHLATLPPELILLVAEDRCLSTHNLAAFALAGKQYADLVMSVLYKRNIREENASACKTFWVNQRNTWLPLAWCAPADIEAYTVLWAVLNENTNTMALLIRYGADINSVEASTHLYQSPSYRWMRRLRRWDSHAENDDSRQTGSWLSSIRRRNARILPPAALLALPPAGAPLIHFLAQFPGLGRVWRIPGIRRMFRFSPLALAARKGLTTAVKWLLENDADPEVPALDLCRCDNEPMTSRSMWRVPFRAANPLGQPHWTALHLAIHHGHEDIVELLVAHGANTRQVCRPEDGPCSALHTAFIHQRKSTVESLMYRFEGTDMVDINARGRCGMTPLHIAYCVQSAEEPLVDLALKFGAYVNLEYEMDGNQWTLFSMACAQKDWKFARRLLRLGANSDFDLERQFGGRWTRNDFRRDIAWSNDREVDWDKAALAMALDKLVHDHEVAWQ